MTKKQFLEKMEELKADLSWNQSRGPFTCTLLGFLFKHSFEVNYQYRYIFSRERDSLFYFNGRSWGYIVAAFNMEHDEDAKSARVCAILLFEQYCLSEKLYLEF